MQMWHAVFVFWAVILLAVFANTCLGRAFPSIEAMMLILHIVGFFAILIVLVYLASKNSTDAVFRTFLNGAGLTSDTQSVLVGAVTLMYSFNGICLT